jgi:hypothetical protein
MSKFFKKTMMLVILASVLVPRVFLANEPNVSNDDDAACDTRCGPQLANYIDKEVDKLAKENGGKDQTPELISVIKETLKASYKPECSTNQRLARTGTVVGAAVLTFATGGLSGLVAGTAAAIGGSVMMASSMQNKPLTIDDVNASPITKAFIKKHKSAFNITGGDKVVGKVFGTRCWGNATGKDLEWFNDY